MDESRNQCLAEQPSQFIATQMLENIYFWTWSFLEWSSSSRLDVRPVRELPCAPRHPSPLLFSPFRNPDWNEGWPKPNEIPRSLSWLRDSGKVLSWLQTTVADSPHRKHAVTGSGVWQFPLHGKALGQPLENMALSSCVFMAWKSKCD